MCACMFTHTYVHTFSLARLLGVESGSDAADAHTYIHTYIHTWEVA